MLILALLLMFQNPNQVALPVTPMLGGTINGRVVVDKGETPLVDVRLKNDTGTIIHTVQSFANGTFRITGVGMGRFSLEVADARYLMSTVPLWIREPEDLAGIFTMRLVRNDSAKDAANESEVDRIDLNALELDARIPSAALAEFRKGIDGLREKSKDSETYFKKSVELAPDFYEGHVQLGLEQARLKKLNDAIRSFERAVALKPTMKASLSMLGRLYVEGGQFQKGIDTMVKIGPLGPLSADDRYNLGVAFYRLDNVVAAQQQLELAVSLAPNKNPAAYVQLHNAYVRNGNPEAALIALETYLKLFPDDRNRKSVEDVAKKLRESLRKPIH